MPTKNIIQFNGGMGKDARNQNFAYASYVKNFDIWSNENRLTPYRSSADLNAGITANAVRNFLQASIVKTLGLGVTDTNNNYPQIFYKTDLTTETAWSTYASAGSSYALRTYDCFVEYKDYVYGWNTNGLFRFGTLSSTLTMTEGWQALANTDATQGLVHSQDDILYLPYANSSGNWIIATWDNSTFTASALALPTNIKVVRIVEYGAFLAIVCAPKTYGGQSRLLIWDRDSSLTTLTGNYNLGEVNAKSAGNVDGKLFIVSIQEEARSSTSKLVFHSYSGGMPLIERVVQMDSSIMTIKGGQVVDSRFYFAVQDTASGTAKWAGIWCIGRKDINSPFSVAIARDPSIGTTGTDLADNISGFLMWKDICVASWDTHEVSITDDVFGIIGSKYETQIINGNDSTVKKKLIGASVSTVSQPSSGDIVLKYKK